MAWQGNVMGAAWARHAMCASAFRRYSLADQRVLKGNNGSIICGGKSWEYNIKFDISENLAVWLLEKLNCLGKGFIVCID